MEKQILDFGFKLSECAAAPQRAEFLSSNAIAAIGTVSIVRYPDGQPVAKRVQNLEKNDAWLDLQHEDADGKVLKFRIMLSQLNELGIGVSAETEKKGNKLIETGNILFEPFECSIKAGKIIVK